MSGFPFGEDRHYLALDTSGPSGFVAVGRGGRSLARARLERKGQHASRLVPAIHRVLEQGSVELAEVAGIIVGEGPGSFTGVRVAAATAKGMARALDIPLWAVSSLAAGAVGDLGQGGAGVRYVLFDARGERVYGGCYGVGSHGVETLLPPHAGDLRSLLAGDVPAGPCSPGTAPSGTAGLSRAADSAWSRPPWAIPRRMPCCTCSPSIPTCPRWRSWPCGNPGM